MKKILTAFLIAAAINYALLRDEESVAQKIYDATVTVSIVTNNTIQQLNPFTKDLVTTHNAGDVVSTGTAFHLGDGYYATAFHVVRADTSDTVDQFNIMLLDNTGEIGSAMVVHYVEDNDVAIMYCDNLRSTPTLEYTTSIVNIGDDVISCGNGFNLGTIISRGVCSGFIMAKDANLDSVFNPFTILYVTDSAINPGSSGGPLCDSDGNVIGLNSAILGPSGGFDGISIHIPIEHAITSLNQSKAGYSKFPIHRSEHQVRIKEMIAADAKVEDTDTNIVEE